MYHKYPISEFPYISNGTILPKESKKNYKIIFRIVINQQTLLYPKSTHLYPKAQETKKIYLSRDGGSTWNSTITTKKIG